MKSVFSPGETLRQTGPDVVVGVFGCPRLEVLRALGVPSVHFLTLFEAEYDAMVKHLMTTAKPSLIGPAETKRTPFLVRGLTLADLEEYLKARDMWYPYLAACEDLTPFRKTAYALRTAQLHAPHRKVVELTFTIPEHPEIRVIAELFASELPTLCARFEQLCVGSEPGLGYKGTGVKRVYPNLCIQFGELSRETDLCFLDDERHLYSHDTPGLLGFVHLGDARHTNRAQFYITFDSLPLQDRRTVVFGRVLEGLADLRVAQERPLTIASCAVYATVEPEETTKAELHKRQMKQPMPATCELTSPADLQAYQTVVTSDTYYSGPKELVLGTDPDDLDLEALTEIPWHDLARLTLRTPKIGPKFIQKFFVWTRMFPRVSDLQFFGCDMNMDLLTKLIGAAGPHNPTTALTFQQVTWTDQTVGLFEAACKLTNGFQRLQTLAFIGCPVQPDSLAFLEVYPRLCGPSLTHLTLSGCGLTDDLFSAWVHRMTYPNLRTLNLSKTAVTSASLALLTGLETLEHLDLSRTRNIEVFLRRMLTSRQSHALRHLNLADCGLSPSLLPGFIGNLKFAQLRELVADRNSDIVSAVVSSVQALNAPSNLRLISMKDCGLDVAELAEMAHAADQISLTKIEVGPSTTESGSQPRIAGSSMEQVAPEVPSQ